MIRIILIIYFTNLNISCFSQNNSYFSGARSTGIGETSLTHSDAWSLFNNPGSLGTLTESSFAFGYQNRFNLPEWGIVTAGYTYSHQNFSAGLGYFRFGDQTFNHQKIHLAAGNRIQRVSMGLGIHLIQYHLDQLRTFHTLTLDFGSLITITHNLLLGLHLFSFTHQEYTPAILRAGLSYRSNNILMFNIEALKQIGYPSSIKVGTEYQLIENIMIRAGVITFPFCSTFGIGFHPAYFKFDYGIRHQTLLGQIHEISISFSPPGN